MRLKFDVTPYHHVKGGHILARNVRANDRGKSHISSKFIPFQLKHAPIHSMIKASISSHQWSMVMACLTPFHSAQDGTSSKRAPSAATLLLRHSRFSRKPNCWSVSPNAMIMPYDFACAFCLLRLTRTLTPPHSGPDHAGNRMMLAGQPLRCHS
jgi:hypothetical protein